MPPITVVFVITGIAVFLNACYFLGIGADKKEGSPDPVVTVGYVTLTAGIVDLVNSVWIIQKLFGDPAASDTGVRLAGLLTFYSIFFVALGVSLIKGLDLRPVGNLAVIVAIFPLFWFPFFDGGPWMLKSVLVVWVFSFLGVTALTYGLVKARIAGVVLLVTALYTFLVPAAILGSGHMLP